MRDFLNSLDWLQKQRPQDRDLHRELGTLIVKVFPEAVSTIETMLNSDIDNNFDNVVKESTMKKWTPKPAEAGAKPKKLVPKAAVNVLPMGGQVEEPLLVDENATATNAEDAPVDKDDLVAMASLSPEKFAEQFDNVKDLKEYATQYGIETTKGAKKDELLIEVQQGLTNYVQNPD